MKQNRVSLERKCRGSRKCSLGANFVRTCEESEFIDVTKISSQGPSLLRIVEQIIDVTEISKIGGEVWQRTVTQFLDDARHELISRIFVCTRKLNRIVSLFEIVKGKDVQ